MPSRRRFLKNLGTAAAALPLSSFANSSEQETEKRILPYNRKYTANDTIRIGCIGMGIMGVSNARTTTKIPGVELVAVADLYEGRLERTKEVYGQQIFTTRN